MVPIRLILDRLLHASDASDVRSSLAQLQERVVRSNNADQQEQRNLDIMELVQEDQFVSTMCNLVSSSQIFFEEKQRAPLFVEDGSFLVCDLLLNLLAPSGLSGTRNTVEQAASKALLSSPSSTLVSSLVDVLTNKSTSTYGRILSMKLVSRVYTLQPSLTQADLIHKTPDGLNRLVDLLDVSEEERIRNEVLVLLITLAKSTSNTFRQMLLFAEGIEKSLQIAVTSEDSGGCGGLSTKINELVLLDCTSLISSILQMGGAAPDILLGSTSSLKALAYLCDGRQGKQFLHKEYKNSNSNTMVQQQHRHISMDDLLASDGTEDLLSNNTLSKSNKSPTGPMLTTSEDLIVQSCLNIILFCINSQQDDDEKNISTCKKIMSRRKIIAGNQELMGIIKSWALYNPHSSLSNEFVASAPREGTQQVALQILSTLCTTSPQQSQQDIVAVRNEICDMVDRQFPTYNPNTTTDDFFYDPLAYKLLDLIMHCQSLVIMAAAISALRSFMSQEQASVMVLHALAPPPPSPEEEAGGELLLPSPVQSLIDILADEMLRGKNYSYNVLKIQGATAALGVVLQVGGTACKEMLLNIPISSSVLTSLTPATSNKDNKKNGNRQFLLSVIASWLEEHTDKNGAVVRASVMRFLCEWCTNCQHVVVNGVFSSLPDPMCIINFIFAQQHDARSDNLEELGLAALLLGLWMEYLGEKEHAGWSRSIILNLVRNKLGLSQFTELLESTKARQQNQMIPAGNNTITATASWWRYNENERKLISDWYADNVDLVRRRLVKEITGSGHQRSASGRSDDTVLETNPLLSSLVEQQAAELEILRNRLKDTTTQLTLTRSECRQWRVRCESSSLTDTDEIAKEIELSLKAQKEAMALREELDARDTALKDLQEQKDRAENDLRNEMSAIQSEKIAFVRENETISQELQSLSQAYYNLEEEIRRLTASNGIPGQEQSKGEDSASKDVSVAFGANDGNRIEALQFELQEMRDRNRAADEWMAMAVDRMNALSAENEILQAQLLREQPIIPASSTFFHEASSKTSVSELNGNQAQSLHDKNIKLQQLLEDVSKERDSLIAKTVGISSTSEGSLETEGSASSESFTLKKEVEMLRKANLEAQEWMSNAVTYNENLVSQNEELTKYNHALKEEISILKKISDANMQVELHGKNEVRHEVNSLLLEEELATLREEYTKAQEGMSNAVTQQGILNSRIEGLTSENITLKQKITEFKAQQDAMNACCKPQHDSSDSDVADLNDTQRGATSSEFGANKFLEELTTLRKANAEAQEWIANALGIQEYTNSQVDGLKLHVSSLEQEIISLKNEKEKLVSDMKNSFDLAKSHPISEAESNFSMLTEEVLVLRKSNAEAQEWISNAVTYHENLNDQIEMLNAQVSSLKQEILELNSAKENAMATGDLAALTEKLDNPISSPDTAATTLIQEEVLQLRKSYEEAQEWMSNAVSHQEFLNTEIQNLTSKNLALEEEIAALRFFGADQATKDQNATDFMTTSHEELTTLRDANAESQQSLAKAVAHDQYSNDLIHDLTAQNNSLAKEILELKEQKESVAKDLKEQLDARDSEICKLSSQLQDSAYALRTETENTQLAASRSTAELQSAKIRISELEYEKSAMESRISLLMESESNLQFRLEAFEEIKSTLEFERDALKEELQVVTDALEELKSKLAASEEEYRIHTEKLQSNIQLLESEQAKFMEQNDLLLETEREKAETLKIENAEIKESLAVLKQYSDELSAKLDSAVINLEKYQNEIFSLEEQKQVNLEAHRANEETICGLEKKIRDYQDSLLSKQNELDGLRLEWEQDISASKESINQSQENLLNLQTQLNNEVMQYSDKLKTADAEILELQHQLKGKTESLKMSEKEISALIKKLQEAEEHSSAIDIQWKERSDALDSRVEAMQAALKIMEHNHKLSEKTKQDQLDEANEVITEWKVRCKELTNKIEELGEQSSDIVSQWKDRSDLLETTVEELQGALRSLESEFYELEKTKEEQLDAANDAITQWEARCTELTGKIEELQESYEGSMFEWQELQEEIKTARSMNEFLTNELTAAKEQLVSAEGRDGYFQQQIRKEREESEQTIQRLKEAINEHESTLESVHAQLREKSSGFDAVEEKLTSSCRTIEDMHSHTDHLNRDLKDCHLIIGQLQNELREAYETLQTRVTDEISDKAFEKATGILKSQLEEFRSKLSCGREELQKERDCRQLAEQALEQLKTDLFLLMESDENFNGNVREKLAFLSSKAADNKYRKERKAIDDLLVIIEQTQQELSKSKLTEREAIESYESARLDVVVAEKQLSSYKERFSTMEQLLEQSRCDDVTTIELLRSRICFLEDDLGRASRMSEEQAKIMKEELSQVVAEKNQLVRSLREVEASHAALVSARNHPENGLCGRESDIEKLHIEKAELLVSLTNVAAKTEQRLRSLVDVQLSSRETELMIERELRQSLEISLGEKQAELERMSQQLTERSKSASLSVEQQENEASCDKNMQLLQKKYERLTSDFSSVSKANANLREEISTLKLSNEKLLEKCRKSEIEARKIKEHRRFEADIASEIARLKVETIKTTNSNEGVAANALVLYSPGYNEIENTMSAETMYDLILDLSLSVKEERGLYQELLTEHEDLLALLAQQDMELLGAQSNISANHLGENDVF